MRVADKDQAIGLTCRQSETRGHCIGVSARVQNSNEPSYSIDQ